MRAQARTNLEMLLMDAVHLEVVESSKTQADRNVGTGAVVFSDLVRAIDIYHEEATWQNFVVNGLTLVVPKGGYTTHVGGTPSASVIAPAINFILNRLS